ncbi:MAG: ChaN family lipoprotein [Betaproteobacteria bacterium]
MKFVTTAFFLFFACAVWAQDEPATCVAPATWYTLEGEAPHAVYAGDLLAQMAAREVILLGERHDDASHHQWQLQTLAALHLLRPDMVIGFESFPRRVQLVLDRWVAGELSVQQFLDQVEWNQIWSFAPELYLPLFHFARLNRIPMVALNVERRLTAAVRKIGWDAVPSDQKAGVSRPTPASAEYRDSLYEVFRQHQHDPMHDPAPARRTDDTFRFFVEAQLVWDRAMAQALAERLASSDSRRPLVVGVMGSGHIRGGHGVPHQLRDLGVSRVGTLLPVDARRDCKELKRGMADAIFALPDLPRDTAVRPRLGVRLEASAGEVRIADVTAGSLAEKSGMQRGDRILSVAGKSITATAALVAAVRAQPPGTWLPLEIRRDGQTLELIVKFPW